MRSASTRPMLPSPRLNQIASSAPVLDRPLSALGVVVERAVGRSEIPASTDARLLLMSATGPLYHQRVLMREPLTHADADAYARAALGLIGGSRAARKAMTARSSAHSPCQSFRIWDTATSKDDEIVFRCPAKINGWTANGTLAADRDESPVDRGVDGQQTRLVSKPPSSSPYWTNLVLAPVKLVVHIVFAALLSVYVASHSGALSREYIGVNCGFHAVR